MKPAVTTITLLVANLLVIGYILIIDRHTLDSDTSTARAGQLLNFEREAVAQMRFRTQEGEAEIVKQEDGSWSFVAPFEDRVSPEQVAEILKSADEMRINHRIEAKEIEREGWGDDYFGFSEEGIDFEMFDSSGNSLGAAQLGSPTPYENNIYARLKGEGSDQPVKLVWGYLRDVLTLPFNELRDRRLVFAKANEVFRAKFRPPSNDAFEIHIERERERGGDKDWSMVGPLKAHCDQKLVDDLIGRVVKLELEEFVVEPGAEMEAAFDQDKRYEIVIRQRASGSDNSKLTTIEFGELPTDPEDPFVLARVTGRSGLFHVDKRVHKMFEMDGNSLRDRTLGNFEYDAVSSVSIQRLEKEEIVLKRIGNAWVIVRDPEDPTKLESANGRMVKDLIGRINDEEILRFEDEAPADLEPYGLKDPPIKVTITRQYLDPNEVVEAGKSPTLYEKTGVLMIGIGFKNQPAGEAFAAFEGENYVYKISPVLPGAINRDGPLSYKTLQLWPRFTAFDFRRAILRDKLSGPPLEISFDYQRNLWTVLRDGVDVTDDIDRVVLDGYLQFLGRPPRGKNWTARSLRSDDRLVDPDVELTIELTDPQDQKTPRRISFAASSTIPGAKLYYGRVNQSSDVLVLDDETMRALTMPLLRLTKPR